MSFTLYLTTTAYFYTVFDNNGLLSSPINLLVSAQDGLSNDDGLVPVPLLQLAPKKPARQAKPRLDRLVMTTSSSLSNRKGKSFYSDDSS